jgi:hypothetical protein
LGAVVDGSWGRWQNADTEWVFGVAVRTNIAKVGIFDEFGATRIIARNTGTGLVVKRFVAEFAGSLV